MNTKNKEFMSKVREAIEEYASEVSFDSQHNVAWHENTATAHAKLLTLLDELDEELSKECNLPHMPNDLDCSGLVYSAKEGKMVPVGEKPETQEEDALGWDNFMRELRPERRLQRRIKERKGKTNG